MKELIHIGIILLFVVSIKIYEKGKPMKIAFHTHSLELGGTERVVTNLAKKFAEHGYDVSVVTVIKGEREYELDSRVKREVIALTPEESKHNTIYRRIKLVRNLRDYINREKPDIIISFLRNSIFRALEATNGKMVPVCGCVRIDPVGHYDSFSRMLRVKWLFPKAAAFVFQTKQQREFFNNKLLKKSKVILNPVHSKYISEPVADHRVKEVVQSCRLTDFKNQSMLLDAFYEVHDKHPDHILKIYGIDGLDGTKEKLEKKIEEYSAQDYMLLMGGSDSLEKDLKYASVYVLSSDYEGLPNALMEAMALGLPVVSTDCPCGGPGMIIEHMKNGMLVPVRDKDRMRDAIMYLIENPEEAEKMGREALKIKEIANEDTIFNEWKEYIEEIVEEWKNK